MSQVFAQWIMYTVTFWSLNLTHLSPPALSRLSKSVPEARVMITKRVNLLLHRQMLNVPQDQITLLALRLIHPAQ